MNIIISLAISLGVKYQNETMRSERLLILYKYLLEEGTIHQGRNSTKS